MVKPNALTSLDSLLQFLQHILRSDDRLSVFLRSGGVNAGVMQFFQTEEPALRKRGLQSSLADVRGHKALAENREALKANRCNFFRPFLWLGHHTVSAVLLVIYAKVCAEIVAGTAAALYRRHLVKVHQNSPSVVAGLGTIRKLTPGARRQSVRTPQEEWLQAQLVPQLALLKKQKQVQQVQQVQLKATTNFVCAHTVAELDAFKLQKGGLPAEILKMGWDYWSTRVQPLAAEERVAATLTPHEVLGKISRAPRPPTLPAAPAGEQEEEAADAGDGADAGGGADTDDGADSDGGADTDDGAYTDGGALPPPHPTLASVLGSVTDLLIAHLTIAQGLEALATMLSEIRHLAPKVRELVVQQLYVELNCIQFAAFETRVKYCLRRLLAQTMKPLIRQQNSLAARFRSMAPPLVKLITGGTHTIYRPSASRR
jgi:hypothetical protein